jgi:glycine cleavage system H protein
MKPEDLLYCETHEWVGISEENGEKIATVGISKFALDQLTDLVYLELPEVGTAVSAGSEFAEVESVKAVSPIYCPVDGEVIAVNSDLVDDLDTMAADPYQKGWLVKMKVTDDSNLARLLSYSDYQKQCAEHG